MAEVILCVYCRTPRNPPRDVVAIMKRCRDRDLHLFSVAFVSSIFSMNFCREHMLAGSERVYRGTDSFTADDIFLRDVNVFVCL